MCVEKSKPNSLRFGLSKRTTSCESALRLYELAKPLFVTVLNESLFFSAHKNDRKHTEAIRSTMDKSAMQVELTTQDKKTGHPY